MEKEGIRIGTDKIGRFLKDLNGAERIYLEQVMRLSDNMQELQKHNNLSNTDFCELFNIKPSKYENYISGNYNYTVKDMALLNAAYVKLKSAEALVKIEGEVPVKVAQ